MVGGRYAVACGSPVGGGKHMLLAGTYGYGIFETGVVLRYHVIPGETVFMMYRVVFEETSTRSHFFECCF